MYHNDGYGTLDIRLDGARLKGIAVNMEHHFLFEHVSGEYWLGMIRLPHTRPEYLMPTGVQFVTGVDGVASDIKMTFTPPGQDLGEPTVNFNRVTGA